MGTIKTEGVAFRFLYLFKKIPFVFPKTN